MGRKRAEVGGYHVESPSCLRPSRSAFAPLERPLRRLDAFVRAATRPPEVMVGVPIVHTEPVLRFERLAQAAAAIARFNTSPARK